jgi:hypothetical protein
LSSDARDVDRTPWQNYGLGSGSAQVIRYDNIVDASGYVVSNGRHLGSSPNIPRLSANLLMKTGLVH